MKSAFISIVALGAMYACSTHCAGESFRLIAWNVESGGAEPATIGARIKSFEDVDLWALSEVAFSDADLYIQKAQEDESASYAGVIGNTGGGDRLLIIYDEEKFELLDAFELEYLAFGGGRAPLVAELKCSDGTSFLAIANHFHRTDAAKRLDQAHGLRTWAATQTLPIVTMGDFNFDFDLPNGPGNEAFQEFSKDNVFNWERPNSLAVTNWADQDDNGVNDFNSVLDFIWTAGAAQSWNVTPEIIVEPGDFPDNALTSDHRPVAADIDTTPSEIAAPVATSSRLRLATIRSSDTTSPVSQQPVAAKPEEPNVVAGDFEHLFCAQSLPDQLQARLETRDRLLKNVLPEQVGSLGRDSVVQLSKRWLPGQVVTVAFRGGSYELRKSIADAADDWCDHCNLRFDFGHNEATQTFREWSPRDSNFAADIRIGFSERGYWSLVGTDSRNSIIVRPGQASMNLERFDLVQPASWRGTVLHEFGHAIGFHHLHQQPAVGCDREFRWDDDPGYILTADDNGRFIPDDMQRRPGVYTVLGGPPNEWPMSKVNHNLRQLNPSSDLQLTPFDSQSIMLYAFPEWMLKNGASSHCFTPARSQSLSAGDQTAALGAYPRQHSDLAAITATRNEVADQLTSIQSSLESPVGRNDLRQVYANVATNPLCYWTIEEVQVTRNVPQVVMKDVQEERTQTYTVMVPHTEKIERNVEEIVDGKVVTKTIVADSVTLKPESRTRTNTVTKMVPETVVQEITVNDTRPVQNSFDVLAIATATLRDNPNASHDDLLQSALSAADRKDDPVARRFVENELQWLFTEAPSTGRISLRSELKPQEIRPAPSPLGGPPAPISPVQSSQ